MAGYNLDGAEGLSGAACRRPCSGRSGHTRSEIIDAGVSGDTTSGGLARLDWSIPEGVDGVILELGANDALRGLPPEKTTRKISMP
jgi:acyl-CoA thioesterase-1